MWVFTRTGFYTVVENQKDKSTVLLRARVRTDMRDFLDSYVYTGKEATKSQYKISFHLNYDYPYRVILPKSVFAKAMEQASMDIDYEKFKEAVRKEQGPARSNFYTMIWSKLIDLEKDKSRIRNYFERHMSDE